MMERLNVEINSGFSLWISFTDTDRDTMVAGAIWSKQKRQYVCRILNRNKQPDLFGGSDIEEFMYPTDAKEWDIMSDIKRRLSDIYGPINYTDNTNRWPHSQREQQKWEDDLRECGRRNTEYWEKEKARKALEIEMIKMVRENERNLRHSRIQRAMGDVSVST